MHNKVHPEGMPANGLAVFWVVSRADPLQPFHTVLVKTPRKMTFAWRGKPETRLINSHSTRWHPFGMREKRFSISGGGAALTTG